jgi:serine/threonine-protein kinase RsbW
LELSVPPSPTRLAGVRRAARACLRGISEEIADDVVMALNEVATNAMLYGSRGGQPVQVQVRISSDWVEASVLDHGPQPPAGRPADADSGEPRAGGWGLWLLRRLVDEVRLERVNLGTRVTLRRALRPVGAQRH